MTDSLYNQVLAYALSALQGCKDLENELISEGSMYNTIGIKNDLDGLVRRLKQPAPLPETSSTMRRFEYQKHHMPSEVGPTVKASVDWLNDLGREGWQLVEHHPNSPIYHFMREVY